MIIETLRQKLSNNKKNFAGESFLFRRKSVAINNFHLPPGINYNASEACFLLPPKLYIG